MPKGPGAEISGQVYVDGAIVETPAQVGETSRATHAHYCVYLVGTHSIAITSHTCEAAPLERVHVLALGESVHHDDLPL